MSFPSWRYGPDGQAEVFQSEADVPDGWVDHPAKVGGSSLDHELPDLRHRYQDVFGKRPFMGWDADTLRAKLAEA